MTANNIFDYKSTDKVEIFANVDGKSSKRNILLFVLVFFLSIPSLIISGIAIHKLQSVQEDVDYLRMDINQLRSGILDTDLAKDLRRFENEQMYPRDSVDPQVHNCLLNDDDDVGSDYDELDLAPTIVVDGRNVDHEDIFGTLKNEHFSKPSTESRLKRDVNVATAENIPINSDSYETAKKKNISATERGSYQNEMLLYDSIKTDNSEGNHATVNGENLNSTGASKSATKGFIHYNRLQSEDQVSPTPLVLSRRSRVYHTENKSKAFRRIIRKPKVKSGAQWESIESGSNMPEVSVIRHEPLDHRRRMRHKQRNNIETLDEKPRGRHRMLPAIQFSGDTSKYVVGQHTNFNGNGHLSHPNLTYVDWIASEWVKSMNMDQYFQMQDGNLKIKETGLYFVYSQIFYLDEHDTNGYRVYKNKDIILQCTTMTHSVERVIKGNTCYTAGLEVLNEGDEISVQDLGTGRYSIFEPGKSFFGVVKMADAKIK
ncbi:hypothetical protein FQA39_LY13461 [Lamprigera yunnana]|nr:hypothetical protein FQA39_LY13461 [Lamprigera yunnana]